MRNMKKIVAATLSTTLCMSMVACGNQTPIEYTDATPVVTTGENGSSEEVVDKPDEVVELTIYSQLCNKPGDQQGWISEMFLEKYNVKIKLVAQGEGTFATRMEAGNLGDIVVFGSTGGDYKQAIEAGLLLNWEEDDMISTYAPYIAEHCEKALAYNKEKSGGDGVYGIGDSQSYGDSHEAFFYTSSLRWDVYKEIGYPSYDTLEDLVPILKQMCEACPTNDIGGKTYAVSLHKSWDGNMVMYPKALAALYGYDEWGFGLYDCKDDTWESCLDKDGMYIRCLKFYNTLYREGLLDPDSMTQEYNDAAEDFQNGTVMWDIFNYMTNLYNTPEHLEAGKAMLSCEGGDFENIVYGISPLGGDKMWTIGATTEYPEICMQIINWMYTPEGTMTMYYGPKGQCWDYDENGEPYLTDFGLTCQKDRDTEIEYGSTKAGFDAGKLQANNTTWSRDSVNPDTMTDAVPSGYTYNYEYWPSTIAKNQSEIEADWSAHIGGYTSVDSYLETEGFMTLCVKSKHNNIDTTPEEIEVVWNQCADEIKNDSWLAIYAKDDAEFDKYINQMIDNCNAYGFQSCYDFCAEQAQVRKEATDTARAAMNK